MNKDNPRAEPPRKPWWIRVANFFSNLFKTPAELRREQEVKQLNAIGEDFLIMQQFTKGINNPNNRNDLINRLASGSVEIRSSLANYLVQINNQLKERKIPKNAEDLLNGLRDIIDEVGKMGKGAGWNLGDKDVPGTWDRWREGMITGIYQAMDSIAALKQEESVQRVSVDLSVLSTPVNRHVEKEKLFAFMEKGLPADDNYREQLKTQLASGRNDLVLNIPAYLHEEMKNLQNRTVSEGLPEKLEKLTALLDEVKKMEKGSAWKTSEVDANTSSDRWFTAMSNTIKLLNGMIDEIQPQKRTLAVPVQQAPVIKEKTQEKGREPQPEALQGQIDVELTTPPRPSTRKPLPSRTVEKTPKPNRESSVNEVKTQGQVTEQATTLPEPSKGPLAQTPSQPPSASGPKAAPRTSGQEVPGRVSTRPAVPTATLPRPSGRGPLPTPGQESQVPSTKENPSRVSAKQVGATPLARPSGRGPLPTPGQGSQAPQTSAKENLSRVTARPGVAPTPVRRKPPAAAVDQPKPLRVSQTGNLPRESQGSTEGIKPVSEPPTALPRKTQGPQVQPGIAKSGAPIPLPRTSQGGQVGNLIRGRKENTGDAPPLPNLPPIPNKKDSPEDSGSTPTNKK